MENGFSQAKLLRDQGITNMLRILEIIGGVLVALWLLGFLLHLFGPLIHIILIVAIIVFLVRFFTGRSTVT